MPVTWLRAVHGREALQVDAPMDADPHVDAIVTNRRGVALAALAADCVPLLLVARQEQEGPPLAVGAVHAGRRGVQAGVVTAAIERLREVAGSRPEAHVVALIGPAICGRCYEVPDAMRSEVSAVVPQAWATTAWGTPALDLPRAAAEQARAAGASVIECGLCTREDARLFSHRGDGRSGRFGSVIGML